MIIPPGTDALQISQQPETLNQIKVPQSPPPAEEKKQETVKNSAVPIAAQKSGSKFSIAAVLQNKEEKAEETESVATAALPASHFSETDLDKAWKQFLEQLRRDDIVIFSAVNSFKLSKKDETTVLIRYPSETSKAEFSKVQDSFFNHFRHLVNNHQVSAEFKLDLATKKEVMTKRKMFEKLAEINPLLHDLDQIMKFDFS